MASVSLNQQTGNRPGWKARFRDHTGRQHTLWLGNCSKRKADEAFRHIRELLEGKKLGAKIDQKTIHWANSLEGRLRDRLFDKGLLNHSIVSDGPRTVIAYMRKYIASRTDWAKSSNHKRAVDLLEEFLGEDRLLSTLDPGTCIRWHFWLMDKTKTAGKNNGKSLSPNTAGQHIKRCRQIMAQAMKDRLIDQNPLAGIKIDLRSDNSKNVFIDETMTKAILEACPDQEWRTLYALTRYGGLRCPSEVLALRWSDIHWDRGRFKVTAPKTARYGKGERVVPLFPELRKELDSLFSLVEPGLRCPVDEFVITRYRSNKSNLRTRLKKIVDEAGVPQFPKPFMAQRASRRTELEGTGQFPNHVLNEWFGHSGAIAETHYLQTTEADFKKAAASDQPTRQMGAEPTESTKDESVVTPVVTTLLGREETDGVKNEKSPLTTLGDASGAGFYTPQRIRTSNLRFRRPMLYPIELGVLVRGEE